MILANTGRKQEAENNFKLAMSKIDRMTDREKYRTRGAYYLMERDYDKAIEQFKALEKQFPADSAGIGNLALAEFYARNMSGAVDDERRVVALYPDNVLYLNNYGLFAMYAGDFDTAIQESERLLKLNPGFEKAYICLGISQLAQGDETAAAETYRKVAPLSAWGASDSAVGLADMALYQGRPADALAILDPAAHADLAANDASRAAAKYVMQAEAWLMKGQSAKAVAAAERASSGSTDESLLYPAAMVFLQAGNNEKALELSQKLSQRLEPDPGAYAKLIEAEVQMTRKDYRGAIRTFRTRKRSPIPGSAISAWVALIWRRARLPKRTRNSIRASNAAVRQPRSSSMTSPVGVISPRSITTWVVRAKAWAVQARPRLTRPI